MNNKINKIIYTAGYLDGDGCFYIGKTIQKNGITVYEFSIQIVSVKIESLQFFEENFGGFIAEKPRRPNHKQPYCWTLKGPESAFLARETFRFLRDKKTQCQLYVDLVETITPNCGVRISDVVIHRRNKIIEDAREEKHMTNFVTKENIESLKDIDIIQPAEEEFAYLAGLIDSEGCFRIKKWKPKGKPNYVYAIALEIGNTRFPIFEFLSERFGGSITFINEKVNKKACAIWSISSFALSQLIPKILPYIIIKKPAAEKVIEFYATTMSNGGDRHSEEFKKLYAEKLIEREKVVDEIHKLNLKGLKP